MLLSIPQISRVSKVFIISLVFLFALTASLLPAAAGIAPGKAAPAKSDSRQDPNNVAAVADGQAVLLPSI